MNRINPQKLLMSKWTATSPEHKRKHFIVIKLIRDDELAVVACEIEAVRDNKVFIIDWQDLKHAEYWLQGWK